MDNWAVGSRGTGGYSGEALSSECNHVNALALIARTHQLMQEGYKCMLDAQLVTVWSALVFAASFSILRRFFAIANAISVALSCTDRELSRHRAVNDEVVHHSLLNLLVWVC
ncbi:hypothetical protein CVT25_001514 [Psilocybe cyanescens]|uniref:Serine/threonine specific protein phosphatases domain-containing protein n=1 Tax=Psilocybe cyanescens TaxID=93625 RepID=A0A409WNK4_PSICY|nr:hypothetical protein CVT25_001514 [Psilocybe cyanescens]